MLSYALTTGGREIMGRISIKKIDWNVVYKFTMPSNIFENRGKRKPTAKCILERKRKSPRFYLDEA
jgi:hypothetical protein